MKSTPFTVLEIISFAKDRETLKIVFMIWGPRIIKVDYKGISLSKKKKRLQGDEFQIIL